MKEQLIFDWYRKNLPERCFKSYTPWAFEDYRTDEKDENYSWDFNEVGGLEQLIEDCNKANLEEYKNKCKELEEKIQELKDKFKPILSQKFEETEESWIFDLLHELNK